MPSFNNNMTTKKVFWVTASGILFTVYFELVHLQYIGLWSFPKSRMPERQICISPPLSLVKSPATSISYFDTVLVLILLRHLPTPTCKMLPVFTFSILWGWVHLWYSEAHFVIGSTGLKLKLLFISVLSCY